MDLIPINKKEKKKRNGLNKLCNKKKWTFVNYAMNLYQHIVQLIDIEVGLLSKRFAWSLGVQKSSSILHQLKKKNTPIYSRQIIGTKYFNCYTVHQVPQIER